MPTSCLKTERKSLNTIANFDDADTWQQMLLEIEDLVGTKKPDERSVMTYVAQFFHAFTSKGKPIKLIIFAPILPYCHRDRLSSSSLSSNCLAREESQINVISTFTEDMTSLMAGIHDYERQAQAVGFSSISCLSSNSITADHIEALSNSSSTVWMLDRSFFKLPLRLRPMQSSNDVNPSWNLTPRLLVVTCSTKG